MFRCLVISMKALVPAQQAASNRAMKSSIGGAKRTPAVPAMRMTFCGLCR